MIGQTPGVSFFGAAVSALRASGAPTVPPVREADEGPDNDVRGGGADAPRDSVGCPDELARVPLPDELIEDVFGRPASAPPEVAASPARFRCPLPSGGLRTRSPLRYGTIVRGRGSRPIPLRARSGARGRSVMRYRSITGSRGPGRVRLQSDCKLEAARFWLAEDAASPLALVVDDRDCCPSPRRFDPASPVWPGSWVLSLPCPDSVSCVPLLVPPCPLSKRTKFRSGRSPYPASAPRPCASDQNGLLAKSTTPNQTTQHAHSTNWPHHPDQRAHPAGDRDRCTIGADWC